MTKQFSVNLDDSRVNKKFNELPYDIKKLKKLISYCKDTYYKKDQVIEVTEEEILGLLIAKYFQFDTHKLSMMMKEGFRISNFYEHRQELKDLASAVENQLKGTS